MAVTDCHVHVNPLWEMRPQVRAKLGGHLTESELEAFLREPGRFLEYLDHAGVDRAVLVNYVSPEIIGYTEKTNDFVLEYARADPRRLIPIGGVLPTHPDPAAEVERLVARGLRGLKVHPPHQLFAPNDYLHGLEGLRAIYAVCERKRVPIIFHTGTSVFPGARNRFGEPLLVEDVAIDFPELPIVLAHGGRPLWMNQAVFLTRRFPNVYLELSGIPPSRLRHYFPELDRLGEKLLWGSDWPGPGVRDIGANLRAFRELGLADDLLHQALEENPARVFSPGPP